MGRRSRNEEKEVQTCNVVHGIETLCKLEHGVGEDTTFSYTIHNPQMHELCTVFHDGKVPSPSGNLDIGNGVNGTVMHAPTDQAFFEAANQSKKIHQIMKEDVCNKYRSKDWIGNKITDNSDKM